MKISTKVITPAKIECYCINGVLACQFCDLRKAFPSLNLYSVTSHAIFCTGSVNLKNKVIHHLSVEKKEKRKGGREGGMSPAIHNSIGGTR